MKLAAMNERFERLVTAAAAMTTPAKSDDVDVGGGRRRVASRELRVDQTEGESVRLEEWGLSGVCPSRLERLAALNSRYERAVAEVRSARAPALRVVAKSSERESLEVWGLSHTTPCVLARLSNMNHVYNALVRVQKAQWRSAVRLWSNPKQQLVAAVTSPEVIAMPNALVVAAAAAVLDGVPSSDGHDLFFDFSLDALSSEHTEWNDNHNIVKLSVLMPQHKTEFLQQLMAQCDGFFGFLQTHLNFSGSYFPNEREIASRRKAADATWERSRPEARADTIDQQSELCKSALDQHDVDEALSSQSALRMNDNFGLLKLRLSMYARMPIEMCACP